MSNFDQATNVLNEYWGYDKFRPAQETVIKELLTNNSAIAILPTGGGKSLCYQIPGLIFSGATLVISPLISLIDDQVNALKQRGISAIALHSRLSKKEYFLEIDNIINQKYKFVYIAPEKLLSDHFISILQTLHISQIAVDEAHCISMWGFDFRPAYRKIALIRDFFPSAYWIALSASATDLVIKDIQQELNLRETKVKRAPLMRKNLRYAVFYEESIRAQLLDLCQRISGSGLIYTRSRKETVEIAQLLQNNDLSADFYHAGLSLEDRSAKQNAWMLGETRIMACTSAFGMGIDKPDVRFVLHSEPPENLEYYYQEAGRAGRAGGKAYVALLYNQEHISKLEKRYQDKQVSLAELDQAYNELYSFFQIAVGSGGNLTFPFSIKEMIAQSSLATMKWRAAIEILRMHELFALSQDIRSQSLVQIKVDTTRTEGFELNHELLNKVIRTIVRKYAGVYHSLTSIDEGFIAQEMGVPKRLVAQYLQRLEEMQIVKYLPQKEENSIRFFRDRVRDFKPDHQKLQLFSQQKEMGYKGMLLYLNDTQECRNKIISTYFGVDQAIPCGVCDNCKALKKTKKYEHEFSKISLELRRMVDVNNNRETLLQELKNKPLHILVLQELIERKIVKKQKGTINWNSGSK